MNERQLIEDLLSALEYHTEQTRPIQFSKVAIESAREYLRKQVRQEPVACKTLCELCVKRGYHFCANAAQTTPITSPPASKPLTDEQEYEAIGTAGNDLLALAKRWADNEVHVYQFDNEARKIIKAVLHRAHTKVDA